jgi:hypothetical protein
VRSSPTSGRAASHTQPVSTLYDDVRSAAVHGKKPPAVSEDEVGKFAWDVRRAINEFLGYAQDEGESIVRRGKILSSLENDPVRAEIKARFLSN